MTLPETSLTASAGPLVLVSVGTPAKVAARLARTAAPLARALGLHLGAPLDPADPHAGLAGLAAAADAPARLVSLPRDPGHALPGGGHWAEALGAWRQPVLVLLTAKQTDSGLPAATTALLRHWQVPCAGLLQWGGDWDAGQRRLEALPWLGCLADGESQAGERHHPAEEAEWLRLALARRWLQLRDG